MPDSVLIGLRHVIIVISIVIIYCYAPLLAVCLAEKLKQWLKGVSNVAT